ncbi:MAG TPA: AMP-binding protein [Gemmatimonadaceae bacterium]|nr:AMP-binding protein [Gemmatimonadaceae bacterium]
MTRRPFVAEALATWRALGLDAADLRMLADRRLAHVLRVARRTPFYGRRLRDAGIGSGRELREDTARAVLSRLPPVTKQDLRAAGPGVLAGGRVQRTWRSSRSSGSTGEPFRVYYDRRAWLLLKHIVKLRARAACGVGPVDRVAILDASLPNEHRPSLLERAGRVRRISVLESRDAIAARLAEFGPHSVYGLPSVLLDVAGSMCDADCIRPGRIFTSGELLLPSTRRRLVERFGCPVFDIYGTSETKEVAWECPDGSRHVNADVVLVEVLDDTWNPLPPGEEGQIVVTLLVNEAMPLLRYRTGDRGALQSGQCRCGLATPLLGVVSGREADVLELDAGQRLSSYALTCALEQVERVQRYRVDQVDRSGLLVRAILDPGAVAGTMEERIRAALTPVVPRTLRLTIEFVDALPDGRGPKSRVVFPMA